MAFRPADSPEGDAATTPELAKWVLGAPVVPLYSPTIIDVLLPVAPSVPAVIRKSPTGS